MSGNTGTLPGCATMKAVVFILVLLAGLKLGHQEYLYRVATRDLIVAAYKDRAVQACLTHARNASLGLHRRPGSTRPPSGW